MFSIGATYLEERRNKIILQLLLAVNSLPSESARQTYKDELVGRQLHEQGKSRMH